MQNLQSGRFLVDFGLTVTLFLTAASHHFVEIKLFMLLLSCGLFLGWTNCNWHHSFLSPAVVCVWSFLEVLTELFGCTNVSRLFSCPFPFFIFYFWKENIFRPFRRKAGPLSGQTDSVIVLHFNEKKYFHYFWSILRPFLNLVHCRIMGWLILSIY
jgi:hypothetical protein